MVRPARWKLGLLGCFCVLPYLLYALGTGDFRWAALLKLAAVAVFTIGIYAVAPVQKLSLLGWQDAAVAVFLISVVLTGSLKRIWNVPVNLDFMGRLFLIAVASWAWSCARPLPSLGYTLQVTRPVLRESSLQFALFAALGVPLSLLFRFTQWNPRWQGIEPFLASYLEIFLFVALLEELFFRGFLQTLLTGSFGSWLKAQLFVSILFGLFHILHAPFPNWRYVGLATLAGWFYGSAYRKTGSITASALVHATVDTVWRTWLTA